MAVWTLLLEPSALLAATVLVLLLWWVLPKRPPGAPPGPGPALPLLGHLHLLKVDPLVRFRQWRRQYGDVFSLYIGGQLVVVLNGHGVIKEALVKRGDVFSDRPAIPFFQIMRLNLGVLSTSGRLWKVTRTTSLQILRQLGMGKNLLAHKVQEEIREYVKVIASEDGRPFQMARLTQTSVSNNICSVIFGKRFDYDDPAFRKYMQILEAVFKSGGGTSSVMMFPAIRFIPGDPFEVGERMREIRAVLDEFIKPAIASHGRESGADGADDFTSAYIRDMDRDSTGLLASKDSETNLTKLVADLFAAGTETTSTTILWTVIYFLHYPETQDKCHSEVMRVIGENREPDIQDRQKMTYLEATIMEVLRIANVVPLAVSHATASDVTFHGYQIPAGCFVIPNLDSVLHDPQVWGDPDNFRPERFIGQDGKLSKPDEFMPFSTGRRVCLGESLARMELFLYLVTLIQRFQFLPPEEGELPSREGILGATYMPKPFKVRAKLRK